MTRLPRMSAATDSGRAPACGVWFAMLCCGALASALLLGAMPVLAAAAAHGQEATIPVEVLLAPGHAESAPLLHEEATADGPVQLSAAANAAQGQLLRLPRGTRAVQVRGWRAAPGAALQPLPIGVASAGAVMRLRGQPLALLTVDADRLAEATQSPGAPELVLAIEGSAGAAGASEVTLLDAAGLRRLAATQRRPDGSDPPGQGCYLIVTPAEYVDALEPLARWKREAGFDVQVRTTLETGATNSEIQDYVHNAYESWEDPPLYLLLVGDVAAVPTFDVSGNVSDHPYATVDGDDFLADLFVGRFAANAVSDVAVQVAKTVNYESRPDTAGADPWFSRALLVAGNYASSTPVALNRWVGERLRADLGYVATDSVFWSSNPQHPWWDGRAPIKYYINAGVGIVNYRGWAYGDAGWEPPHFIDTTIPELENGWRLPVVFSIVCHTGNFGGTCMGEAWLKAGTAQEPRGAVAFFGTGEHWSHSRWNDRVDLGIFQAICESGVRRFGPIGVAAKATLLPHFSTEIRMEDAFADPEESVEYYNYTYNVLGDPSLQLWTATPEAVQLVGLPETLHDGENSYTVHVENEAGDWVYGARVSVLQGDQLIGYVETGDPLGDELCVAYASLDSVTITVTGEDLCPRQERRAVETASQALTVTDGWVTAPDQFVPGTEFDLGVTVRNSGTSDLGSGSLTLSIPLEVERTNGTVAFDGLSAGESATLERAFSVRPAATMEDGRRLAFGIVPAIAGETLTVTCFHLTAAAPAYVVDGLSDGDDDVFSPGETLDLDVTLRNTGSVAAGQVRATLRASVPDLITIVDSTATLAEIAVGATGAMGEDPFRIAIPNERAIGTAVPLEIHLASDGGPQTVVSATLLVGEVDIAAPTGPDAYGYYAYDSADIDYPDEAPAYDWIECSPLYAGAGEKLESIRDNTNAATVALPFTFRYYGVDYDSIRVGDNGWIAFDREAWYDIRNWNMPDTWGCGALVAPFWDNLDPDIEGSDGIYIWHDEARHRFVVEWSRLENWEATTDDFQTFEVVLYDPAYYPTATGDGEILFQYKQINNDDYTRMYATVGIEDPSETIALVYSYSGQYAPGAAPLSSGLAIKLTTDAPLYAPLTVTRFEGLWTAGGSAPPVGGTALPGAGQTEATGGRETAITLSWDLSEPATLTALRLRRARAAADGGWEAEVPVPNGRFGPGATGFTDDDPALQHDACYRYRLTAFDRFGTPRLIGETIVAPLAAARPWLRVASGSVVRGPGPVEIVLSAPPAAVSEFALYDATGRRIEDLRARVARTGGMQSLTWDGRDQSGRRLPSGVYWLRLRAAGETRTTRFVWMR